MKRLLLGTSMLAGLAGPAFADYNSIAIDATSNSGKVGSLAITQDATGSGNTVSSDGTPGTGASKFPIKGAWSSIAITQTGSRNTLQGSIKTSTGSSSTAALTASYTGSGSGVTGGNLHTLTIGGGTAPANPTVTIAVVNNGTGTNTLVSGVGPIDNVIADTIDGTGLTYNLAVTGYGNAVTNGVAGTGAVTLTQGGSNAGITGHDNTVINALAGGAITHALLITGNSNSVTNTVTATGAITLTQGGSGYGIVGDNNTVSNSVGQGTSVTSFTNQLTMSGDGNTVTNVADGAGATAIMTHLAGSSNNTVLTTLSGGGNTANLTADGTTYLDYGLTSAAANSYADIALNSISSGVSHGSPPVVRVEQTADAGNATAYLTLNGGNFTMGTLSSPGTLPSSAYIYSGGSSNSATPGVLVYQASANAYLNATVTAAGNGFTQKFVQ